MVVTLHLFLILAALLCLGLLTFSVPTGKFNLWAAAAFCLVVAVLLIPAVPT